MLQGMQLFYCLRCGWISSNPAAKPATGLETNPRLSPPTLPPAPATVQEAKKYLRDREHWRGVRCLRQ
jgi:hypothetical protein